MQLDPSRQLLYVSGWWGWYHRFLALIVYGTSAFPALMVYGTARDVAHEPSLTNIGLFALAAILLGACLLWCWTTWRDGRSRATRIVLSPDRTLTVRTLNFTSRRVPTGALGDVQYAQSWSSADGEVYDPKLTVQVHRAAPIVVDLSGRIVDEGGFEAVFFYRATKPPRARRKRWKRGAGPRAQEANQRPRSLLGSTGR
jgi:hypothetical protein